MTTLVVERLKGRAPEGENVYHPYGAAEVLLYDKSPEILVEGPSGTGKSRASLEKLHLCALKYPRMRAAIVRKTRESLTQTAMVTFVEKVLPYEQFARFNHEDQEYRYPSGSKITVGGMDKGSKIMSSEYDMIYVQEATELTEDDAETLTTRLRNGVMPYQQLIMDCNPDAPDHWLNKRCVRGVTKRIISRHEDNPSVTAEYLAKLDNLTGYRHKRLRLGLWVAAEGQYFGEWDEEQHICDPFEVPKDWPRWTATDYGFADPFCTLWFTRNPNNKHHIYIYREAYAAGLRDEEQGAAVVRASEGERIALFAADPSVFNARTEQNKPSIAAVYASKGMRPIVPAPNNRIAGWQTARRALAWSVDKKPRLQVMRDRAPNLVRTLPSMVHDPLDSEDLADRIKSVKTEDHAVDTLRYGLMIEAMPPTEQARVLGFEVVR